MKAESSIIPVAMFGLYGLCLILGGIGWILNIIALVAGFSEPLTALQALRIVGVFVAPLGAVLGWAA